MNKKIIMAIVAGLCMLGMNAEAHCGYYRHHGYYHRSAANAFWAGAAGGLVGAVVGNAIAQPQYVVAAPQQVVVQPEPQVVYEQPVQQVVYQEPIVRHVPRSAYQQPVYVQQVQPQVVQQPTYTYNTTTVVQQPQRQTTPLVGVGVNVLGLKVGVGAGF